MNGALKTRTGTEANVMDPKFDIFMRLPDGRPLLLQSFQTFEDAKDHLEEVAQDASGDCFIYSEEKGVVELYVHTVSV
jgi:hypothetical protein